MKNKLLAVALTMGLIGVAHAETSVILYGSLDGGIGYQRIKGDEFKASRKGMINGIRSENQWGLKGTEDLGGGLQAVFRVESGFNLDTGDTSEYDDRLFGRHATLGLQSEAWGRLDLGRQTNIASKYFAEVASPFGEDFNQASVATAFSAADVRYDNMVMYQTPELGGFQFGVGYSFNADGSQQYRLNGGGEPNVRAITTGLLYENGPLEAALTYDQFKTPTAVNDQYDDDERGITVRSWNVAASYDFDVIKLHAGFGQTRNGWFSEMEIGDAGLEELSAVDGLKVNSYVVGVSAPMGNSGEILAAWTMADPRSEDDAKKQNIYSLGYTYALSKRTDLYAIGSYAKNVAFQEDLKATLIGVGMSHKF
ncbi:porin [Pollutimonas subterranea]|uniref:Porin n=1 Tax=Pollutimonas subterranea TaxID=2045210 RepID=A0A2N4U3V6_9BURK|nr:porin [Pollutimonas subterranea]PLC49689.1 porin [Pollutimonas subterranea]